MTKDKFVADCMLGKLARWLRITGYDTKYFRHFEDHKLLAIARFEGRILLTKDIALFKRAKEIAYLVQTEPLENQLKEIFTQFGLWPRFSLARCPRCNEILFSVCAQEIKPQIPLFVFLSFQEFKQCPLCQKVYWPGTHWQKIDAICHELLQK